MLKKDKKKLGETGEHIAAAFLKHKSYMILEQNYFSAYGEIDIIAQKGNNLIFVEVKTRNSRAEDALNSISSAKQAKIIKTANTFLNENCLHEDIFTRFDVIIVIPDRNRKYKVNHITDAFRPSL